MGVSTADVQQAESQKATAAQQDAQLQQQLAQARDRDASLRSTAENVQTMLNKQRQEREQVKTAVETRRQKIENHRKQIEACKQQLALLKDDERARLAAKTAADMVQQRLDKTRAGLAAVHRELQALTSPEAKAAAERTKGADIPLEVVPCPTEDADAHPQDGESLWLATSRCSSEARQNCSAMEYAVEETKSDLRMANQSHAVLVALQRSLVVRATELREGLRQWSFACAAQSRASDLTSSLQLGSNQLEEEEGGCLAEMEALKEEEKEHKITLATVSHSHSQLQSKQHTNTHLGGLLNRGITEASGSLESAKSKKGRIFDSIERQKAEQVEVLRLIDAHEQAVKDHPDQLTRRLTAAKRLLERANEQVAITEADRTKTEADYQSAQSAYAILRQAHGALTRELDKARSYHKELQENHDCLAVDLGSMAKHYMSLMPPQLFSPSKRERMELHRAPCGLQMSGQLVVGSR